MTNQHRATPEQWDDVHTWSEDDSSNSSCILELRARVEALEAANQSWNKKVSKLAGVAKDVSANLETQQRLGWRPLNTETVYGSEPAVDTVRIHTRSVEPAVKESFTTQPGGLVERVADGICESLHCGDTPEDWETEARSAIRAAAAWLRQSGMLNAAELLEQEAGNG